MMQSANWDRVKGLFSDALEEPASRRVDYVEKACGDDAGLSTEVLSLLDAHEGADDYFDEVFSQFTPDGTALGLVGKRLGAYRVLKVLGEGGMGNVYLAERADDEYQQRAAIKILPVAPMQSAQLERFGIEKQALAQLKHPNIARLLDAGVSQDGAPFIVMDYVDGAPIDTYCDEQRLTIAQRLALFDSVCAAVSYAHSHLILHRDLKPPNIMVTGDGETKLLDFGIARILSPDEATSPSNLTTLFQDRPLTPAYAAPEQWRRRKSTTMTDVYSLGAVLFRLLCGARALSERDVTQLRADPLHQVAPRRMVSCLGAGEEGQGAEAEQIAADRGVSLKVLRKLLRGDLQNIVGKAMTSDPALRYPTVDALRRDLDNYLAQRPVTARPPAFGYAARRWATRNKLPLAVAAIVAVLAASTVFTSVRSAHRIEVERDNARRVATLMSDVFGAADPSEENGSTVTVREALSKGSARVLGAMSDQPELQVSLSAQIGRVYSNLNLHADAETHWREVLDLLREIERQGPLSTFQSELRVDALRNLADAMIDRAAHDEAREFLTLARASAAEVLPSGHASYLHIANSATENANAENDIEAALVFAEAAVVLADRDTTLDPLARALAYNNLGVALYRSGRAEDVVMRFNQALALQEAALPPNHPNIVRVKANLAAAYVTLPDLERASQLYSEVIAAGEHNAVTDRSRVQALFGLGLIKLNQGDYREGRRLIEECIQLKQSFRKNPDYVEALQRYTLGLGEEATGNPEAAREQYDIALVTAREKFPDRGLTGRLLAQVAGLAADEGRLSAAREWLAEAEAVFALDDKLKPRHTAYARGLAGWLEAQNGDVAAARKAITDALGDLEAALGPQSPQAVRVRRWLQDLSVGQ